MQSADDKPVSLTPVRFWSNVFGEKEVEFQFRLTTKQATKCRVSWNYKIGLATIAAREVELVAEPDKPAEFAIKLPVPPVKDGVILESRLTIAAFEGNAVQPAAVYSRDLWIFPTDPFVDRVEWLKGLKIRVYDPVQNTVKALTALGVPFEEVNNSATLADLTDGVLIIGEGVSFRDEVGLGEVVANRAAAGVKVLCLAPAEGTLTVPGLGHAAGFRDLSFQRDAIRRLDKRLDAERWAPDGKLPATGLRIIPAGDALTSEVGADGWPWIEACAADGPGRWIYCGYPIVARWADGPTPRYLFARILDHLADSQPPVEKK